ncbi:hypothetical protein BDF14DRAFT_1768555 [Spinellus fusiger]|nr:hypothetical protein BDF14DRAFT_1768555 [Spinellus fusiger]
MNTKPEQEDYYVLLGIDISSNEKAITKAYRSKALKVHPDKNPSPDAAALFHALTEAYEVLKDTKAKAAYDALYRARLEKKKKEMEMDSKRRKAREELEGRENAAKKTKTDLSEAEAAYKAELARLREEGAKRRQEYWKQEEESPAADTSSSELDCALKIKWKRKKYTFTEEDLMALLDPIGHVDSIALSEKKKGSALVVLKTIVGAHAIVTSKDTNPALAPFESIHWASGTEPAIVSKLNAERERQKAAKQAQFAYGLRPTPGSGQGKPLFTAGAQSSFFRNLSASLKTVSTQALSDEDYEAITLMKLRNSEREWQLEKINQNIG